MCYQSSEWVKYIFAKPKSTHYSVISAQLYIKSSGLQCSIEEDVFESRRGLTKQKASRKENVAETVHREYIGEFSQYLIVQYSSLHTMPGCKETERILQ